MTTYQHNHGIKVLSLFDGIGAGYLALKNLGVKVAEYHAFEIDKIAAGIALYNHPDIIQHGDVRNIDFEAFRGFDLLLCGSPCQDLSHYTRGRKGLEGSKSCLFWYGAEAVQRKLCKYFLFENVGGMPVKDRNIITKVLGVEPIKLCSSLYSAQTRNRLYWVNFPVHSFQQSDAQAAQDVLEYGIAPRRTYTAVMTHPDSVSGLLDRMQRQRIQQFKAIPDNEGEYLHGTTCWPYAQRYYNLEVGQRYRLERLLAVELERLQTMPDDYTRYRCYWADNQRMVAEVGYHARHHAIGNSWTIKVIEELLLYVWMDWNYPDKEMPWETRR